MIEDDAEKAYDDPDCNVGDGFFAEHGLAMIREMRDLRAIVNHLEYNDVTRCFYVDERDLRMRPHLWKLVTKENSR